MMKFLFILTFCISSVMAQDILNITGRVSVRMTNTDYDENSDIKPDSIPEKDYGKTILIPGLQQNLNLALFARAEQLDITLLADVRNNDWNRITFSDFNSVDRMSLNARFGEHEIVLGDFFESNSELFIQSREIRGARASFRFNGIWSPESYVKTQLLYGTVQRPFSVGGRLLHLYKQYETSGLYKRSFIAGSLTTGQNGRFYSGIRYLKGADDKSSISESLNDPLKNESMGGHAGIYLFRSRIHVFGEGYLSKLDTIDAGKNEDQAYKAGMDLRFDRFSLVAFYQRLGYNYFSSGYPFLLNDRAGFKVTSAYYLPDISTFSLELEQYNDNLDQLDSDPTTDTRLINLGVSSNFRNLPELTLRWGYRDDNSNTLFDQDQNKIMTSRVTRKYEGRLGFNTPMNRFSLSMIYLDFDDHSLLSAGSPLGTEQLIGSANIYTRPVNNLYISGGVVYSRLNMTSNQENDNIYAYETSRWDILPGKLKMESTLSLILNDAANGGVEDMLSNYWQVLGEASVEYFFNNNISVKLVGGTDTRRMDYSTKDALQIIATEYGPTFFNSSESYEALIYGLEINWIF